MHTYLYSIKTEGIVGNSCIQDHVNNLYFSCTGLSYFTKWKNSRQALSLLRVVWRVKGK
jgi:hypothetical protein